MRGAVENAIPLRAGAGDPRPILVKYMLENYGSSVAYPLRDMKETGLVYKCKENAMGKSVRTLVIDAKKEKEMMNIITDCGKNFVAFHILLEQKGACTEVSDGKRHGAMVLYNRLTGRMYLYDLLRFHVRGFKINHVSPKLKKVLAPWLEVNDAGFLDLEDVLDEDDREFVAVNMDPSQTSERVIEFLGGADKPGDWYPLLALWEIHTMMMYPTLLRTELEEKMMGLPKKKLDMLLGTLAMTMRRTLAEVYASGDAVCSPGIFNAEDGICVDGPKKLGSVSTTDERGRKVTIRNVPLVQIHKDVQKRARFGGVEGQLVMLMYLKHKYKRTGVYLPRRLKGAHIDKDKYAIQWLWNDEKGGYELRINPRVADGIRKGLKDPKTDKFIIPLRLVGHPAGSHLNTLFVDKTTGEVEHFEPHGSKLMDKYHPAELYQALREYLEIGLEMGLRYISPYEFLPNVAFPQSEETNELGYQDEYGACAIWSIWYLELRLSHWGQYGREELLRKALRKLKQHGSFRVFVRTYEKYYMPMIQAIHENYFEGDLNRRQIHLDPALYLKANK